MKVIFVAMGWENISIQYLSAVLKQAGHETKLVYDQSLFDDKNYLCIPALAKLFDMKDKVVRNIIKDEPELLVFSVLTTNYLWALDIAKRVKKEINTPILFGGIHPSSVPEKVIKEENVDIICLGEGERAIVELCDSIEKGEINYNIKNLWFKTPAGIIKNPKREQIEDLDSLPLPDKALFEKDVPMGYYHLSVLARGCPFTCSYCSLSFEAEEWKKIGGRRFRERSVDSAIAELKYFKDKYNFKWIDFRHSVMSGSTKWLVEFCEKYSKEINLPFRMFWHPNLIDKASAKALKSIGKEVIIQLGLESYNEDIRFNILNRKMTNKKFHEAIEILERNELKYSLDYILGLPGQEEQELIDFAKYLANLKHCYRVSSFMLQYLPSTEIINKGLEAGCISKGDVENLEEGKHENYMSNGSVSIDKNRLKVMNSYRILYRIMPLLPCSVRRLLIKYNMQKVFRYLPARLSITAIDIFIGLKDRDGITYAKNYMWWMAKRLKS